MPAPGDLATVTRAVDGLDAGDHAVYVGADPAADTATLLTFTGDYLHVPTGLLASPDD